MGPVARAMPAGWKVLCDVAGGGLQAAVCVWVAATGMAHRLGGHWHWHWRS
jgi:hypothetical protein